MGWRDDLQSKTTGISFAKKARSAPQAKSPRDVLLRSLDDNISYLKDPTFTISSGRQKGKKPTLVYELEGTDATIELSYARSPIMLDGDSELLIIPKEFLGDALQALRSGAANGEFDAQLDAIKLKRAQQRKKN